MTEEQARFYTTEELRQASNLRRMIALAKQGEIIRAEGPHGQMEYFITDHALNDFGKMRIAHYRQNSTLDRMESTHDLGKHRNHLNSDPNALSGMVKNVPPGSMQLVDEATAILPRKTRSHPVFGKVRESFVGAAMKMDWKEVARPTAANHALTGNARSF